MGGPKRIVELPSNPRNWVALSREAHHLHMGKLWSWVPVGCALCIESPDASDQTLQSVDDMNLYYCPNHGELEKVPYTSQHTYVIQLGEHKVEGSRRAEDFFLLPKSQTKEERDALIAKILAEGEDYETEHDPIMGDD